MDTPPPRTDPPAAPGDGAAPRPVVIAIHGVGYTRPRQVAEAVTSNLSSGNVPADVREFHWNSPDLDPYGGTAIEFWSIETLAQVLYAAADAGFGGRGPYVGLGRGAVWVHDALARFARFAVGLGFALALVLPPLTTLVLYPMRWVVDLTPEQVVVVGLALAAVFGLAILAALGLVLLGCCYAAGRLARGRSDPAPRLAPLWVSLRRATLILLTPLILILLPPFTLPARTAAGWCFNALRYVAVVVGLVTLAAWLAGGSGIVNVGLAAQTVAVLVVGLVWAVGWATRIAVRPVVKVLLDIFRYIGDGRYRNRIQAGLAEAVAAARPDLRGGPLFLVGHSLGSVIAADCLVNGAVWQPADRVTLVTGGSPLRRFFFRFLPHVLFPPSALAVGAVAAGRLAEFRWVNVYRRWDYVGRGLSIPAECGADRCAGRWLRFVTSHSRYWDDPVVRTVVLGALAAAPVWPAPGGPPPGDWFSLEQRIEVGEDTWTAGYWAVGFVILALTLAGFGYSKWVSKREWDAQMARVAAELNERGVEVEADVVHWKEEHVITENVPVYESTPQGTRTTYKTQIRYEYENHFEFHFVPAGREPVVRRIDFRGISDHSRFFDPDRLREVVRGGGEPYDGIEKARGAHERPVHLRTRLRYLPESVDDVDAMWIALPDVPPGSQFWRHVWDWLAIAFLSVLAVFVALGLLRVGYPVFWYFVRPTSGVAGR